MQHKNRNLDSDYFCGSQVESLSSAVYLKGAYLDLQTFIYILKKKWL